ncbi:hypothetical protein NRB15_22175 [Pseudomonas alliivorans]|uniref:dermonecrotic toxin domain-containing protein n=1 Tax=Pseudomonas alliivorans TaxID=2810613 RepID=UPI00211B7636|nr:DUF6543 domain-containing protein [Pseudomonas alliivorans]MCQ9473057.1 hypothetical protein [Pseudomonas alliivorans]
MSALPPYFSSESLSARFSQDVQQAVSASRITSEQGLWLGILTREGNDTQEASVRPRVDRFVRDDGAQTGSELATALMVSDPDNPEAPVFLSTLLSGIERFDSRQSLLVALRARFDEIKDPSIEIDSQQVDGPIFPARTRLIIVHQAKHLEQTWEQVHELPELRTALGRALTDKLQAQEAALRFDAFNHPVQLINTDVSGTDVVGTDSLVNVAVDQYVYQTLPAGMKRQYLDASGGILSERQSGICSKAVSDAVAEMGAYYERSLMAYWSSRRGDGLSVREFCARALAETLRYHLLAGRNDGLLTEEQFQGLRTLLPSSGVSPESRQARVRRLSAAVGGQEPVKLIGLFVINFESGSPEGLYLYSCLNGFRRFDDLDGIGTLFSSAQGRSDLLQCSSLNDHPLLRAIGGIELFASSFTGPLFDQFLDSVIALQQRSLRHACALSPIGYEKTSVRLDDALDIRGLLDVRLLELHDLGRWRAGRTDFEGAWESPGVMPYLEPESSGTWAGKLQKMELLLERVSLLHSGVDGCMRHGLNHYLALLGEPGLDARTLWIASKDGAAQAVPLLSWVLGRVCGDVDADFTDVRVMRRGSPLPGESLDKRLPMTLLEQMVDCVLTDFAQRFERQISGFYARQIRYLDMGVHPGATTGLIREYALRLEVIIRNRTGGLDDQTLLSVQQVLNRPLPALRDSLGDKRVDPYTLSVRWKGLKQAIVVPNAFVLTKPGHIGSVVLWLSASGLRRFDTVQDMKSWFSRQMTDQRAHLVYALAEPDIEAVTSLFRQEGAPSMEVELHATQGHFIETLQVGEIKRQQQTATCLYQKALKRELSADLFRHLMSAVESRDANRQVLNRLGMIIQNVINKTSLPEWVNTASSTDQIILINILQHFYVACVVQKDFLFGLPSLYDYSLQQLANRLARDFPQQTLDPEEVKVTLTHYVSGLAIPGEVPTAIPAATERVSQTLSEFAVNRFMSRQDGVISLSAKDGTPLPGPLTVAYVRDMVDSLNVAQGYRSLMDGMMAKDDPAYAERQKLFVEQLPATGLLRAFTSKLKKELSEDAFHFIAAVMDMPDGIARLPVGGRKVVLSPLRLLPASEGWAPTTVINIYIIAPERGNAGPWVLYSPFHNDFAFKEYADEAALLTDIHTSRDLQAMILERIDPQERKLYDNGGFTEPHLPFSAESTFDLPFERPKPVTLSIQPYEGNVLDLLLNGTIQALKLQVKQESVTSAELKITAARYLFGLVAEQTMAFLPGRLGALVGIWQGRDLLNLSAISAGERQWGKALAEFMAALSMLISSGMGAQATEVASPEEVEVSLDEEVLEALDEPPEAEAFPRFSWSNNSLTQEILIRLRPFEIRGVSLNTLRKDDLFNTYNDPVNGKKYAAINGRVYELKSDQDGWFIVAGDKVGPPVVMDEEQRWKLDLHGGLKGGGALLTRVKSSIVDAGVDDVMSVDSQGMLEIRRTFRGMAQAIEEGHAQAQHYLENCLDNLCQKRPDGSVEPRVKKVLADFFDESEPDERMYEVVQHAVTQIYGALMDPTLSPLDSPRYVIGVNRIGHDSSAFIFSTDPMKRIFLTEQFFRLPSYRFKVSAMRSGHFHYGAHYRAAILIHELSHLVLKTEDLAYVDAQAPFADLLEDTAGYRLRLKNAQLALQQKTLSYQTDRSQLFKHLDKNRWRDLRHADGKGKKTILRLAGKATLDEARDVFYTDVHKRTDIMLANADTVALLVTLLGRERLVR